MVAVSYPPVGYIGTGGVRVSNVVADAGSLLVVMYQSRDTSDYMRSRLEPGWSYIGGFAATGSWFRQDGRYHVAAYGFDDVTAIPVMTVTESIDSSNIIDSAPFAPVAFLVDSCRSVVLTSSSTVGYYESVPELPSPVDTSGEVVGYAQGVSVDGNGAYLGTGVEESPAYSTSYHRLTNPGDAALTLDLVRRVRVRWNSGVVEDKAFPGVQCRVTKFRLAFSERPILPYAIVDALGEWVDTSASWRLHFTPYPASARGDLASYQVRRKSLQTTAITYWNSFTAAWDSAPYNNTTGIFTDESGEYVLIPGNVGNTEGSYDFELKLTYLDPPGADLVGPWSNTVRTNMDPPPVAELAVSGTSPVIVMAAGTPSIGGRRLIAWTGVIRDEGGITVASHSSAVLSPWVASVPAAGTYTVAVRVQQTGGAWSDEATETVAVSPDIPDAPVSLTVGLSGHPVSGAPGVAITAVFALVGDDFPWGERRVRIRVDRREVLAGGGRGPWVTVGVTPSYIGRLEFELSDYTAPTSRVMEYRVRAEHTDPLGNAWVSPWSLADPPVTIEADCGWLIDPSDPATAVRAKLMAQETEIRDTRAEAIYTLDSGKALIAAGAPRGTTSGLKVMVEDAASVAALEELLASGRLLLVRWHEEIVRGGPADLPDDRWVAVVGQVSTERVAIGPYAARYVSFLYVEQDAPYLSVEP